MKVYEGCFINWLCKVKIKEMIGDLWMLNKGYI